MTVVVFQHCDKDEFVVPFHADGVPRVSFPVRVRVYSTSIVTEHVCRAFRP